MLEEFLDKIGGFYSISNKKGFLLNSFVLCQTNIDISKYMNSLYFTKNSNIIYNGEYYCDCFVLVDERDTFFYLIEDNFHGISYPVWHILEESIANKKKGQMIKLDTLSDIVFLEKKCLIIEIYNDLPRVLF